MNILTKRYFFLNRECILVNGKNGSVIYNLLSGDIIGLEEGSAKILNLSERGVSINEIARILSIEEKSVEKTLENMLNVGNFYNRRVYIEKIKRIPLLNLQEPFHEPPILFRVFIELFGDCEMNCNFCESPKIFPCLTCSKGSDNFVGEKVLKIFLDRLLKMDCRNLIFHGGDPFANKEKLFSIIDFCRKQGYMGNIFVITNGIHIDEKVIELLLYYNSYPIISIFHFQSKEYYSITKNNGSFEMVKHSLELIQKAGIPFMINTVINGSNCDNIEELEKFARGYKPKDITATIIPSDGNLRNTEMDNILRRKMLIRITPDIFYNNLYHHPCLYGTLAVSGEGNLLPCPFLKSEILGNIKENRVLDRIFEMREIDKYWDMSLSHFAKCKDCKFRFGCFDCYAAERDLSKGDNWNTICPRYIIDKVRSDKP